MNAERWQRVKDLLNNALELPVAERSAYLERACGADSDLRREVETLITSHDQSGDFLDQEPPSAAAKGGLATAAAARTGERIGAYQILNEIGRGGMGTVYLATRADDVFRKRVAVKVLRRGLDSEYILKRFRNERQILASLEHPNIASLLDGGTTPDGEPYFVMEYIDGQPIDEYCDKHRLSTMDRLKLFCKVCSAVQFAHEHRIIHRDIKPANILIHAGEPKLLDFGIAKILDPDFSGDTIDPTVTQLRMMTPEYASPEQIRGEQVSEAADIYSLGVLLYELLTGHKPYRVRSRTPHEIAHAICEEQPQRPSTAIARVEEITGRGKPLTITPEYVSGARSTEPAELRRSLAGDLDNIVLMAMRKEPGRRYASAGLLAGDIMRHLEGRPVRARSDTLIYRTTKLVQRHRGMILAASLAGCGVALAMMVVQRDRTIHVPLSEFTQARTVPFTTFAGDEAQAAFSPDGKRVAFVWKPPRRESPHIYVKDINGIEPLLRLTNSPADDTSPLWSPDGKEIAFLRTARDQAGFYVVPANGGVERRISGASPIAFERMAGRQLAWSSDGKSLIIVDRTAPDRPFALYELRLADGSRQQITDPPEKSVGDAAIALSPDGKKLAFVRALKSGISEVYVQSKAGGAPAQQLTDDKRWISSVAWSPDGKDVLFVSTRTGNPSIWRIGAGGGEPVRLPGVGQNSTDPAFSADGRHLAYSQITFDANIWRFDLKLGRAENLISSTQYDSSPFYSPDGKRIVFRSTRSGSNEIWACDSDGGNPVQLTQHRGPLTGTPRWSPDGKWIAYDSRPEGSPNIYVIPAEGGQPHRFTDTSGENVVPSFSRDGKWIYYASNRGGAWQVWKKPFTGGEPVQVTRNGGFAAFESLDGKYVYYAKARAVPGLWRVPVDGGEEKEVVHDLKAGYWGHWAPTARGIVYIDTASAAAPAMIYLVNPDTGRKQVLAEITRPLALATSAFAISPDGRYALYTQQDQSSSDITLAEAATR